MKYHQHKAYIFPSHKLLSHVKIIPTKSIIDECHVSKNPPFFIIDETYLSESTIFLTGMTNCDVVVSKEYWTPLWVATKFSHVEMFSVYVHI